jgi:hypothetical protein
MPNRSRPSRGAKRRSLAARSACLALLASAAAAAQAQVEDEQLWLQANTNVPLAPDLRVTLEQIARFGDRQDGLYQSEIGALLGYRVAPGIEIGAGYRYVGAHNGNNARDEHRLRQQVVATFGRFTSRLRVDERFHPEGNEIGFRVRPLLRYNHPLDPGRKLGLFVSHESFWLPNRTAWGQRRGYERMRNIVGLTFPLAKAAMVDLGYLNQYRPARSGARAQMDHALTLQLTISLTSLPGSHVSD